MLRGRLTAMHQGVATVELEGAGKVTLSKCDKAGEGTSVLFCIRPERMKLSMLEPKGYENGLRATVKSKLYVGDTTHYLVKLQSGTLIKVIEQNYLLQLSNEFYDIGEEVFINWSQTSGELIYD